ncbi:MAG: oligopeptide transporter, OPT family [Elusimicrobia bacterium CG1_02_63_36]|nr:MAG: oligopeptide transporter, OPT family [Elusimicrobia bacterium CG1_02_63_36]PIP82574.1 MAG: oligopeptide transporter, OPT family [Elusimicrobia bacterium CG22_combo_CG10-13_8_21_14_all_63_91]PJA12953.1 MAG: oligopeptide transporter, OPT family [Elusimicrobia bacterium CG_4_10_14_0_2_um_filter_63_34]PJB25798.1 MAG: oligopeptide transporter, OPT family [Elusimicrobia bacterium CG_4_9_14_3_um_filter_62_55]
MSKQDELTPRAVALGILLSIVMAAANVYLGLKAGMTVSASIPAAVMSMGILRLMKRKGSVLESNLVQTAASAGESLAAGIIFTMPALVIAGVWKTFDFWVTSFIALTGGLLGVLFMIPMRKVFVIDSKELAYPEGIACAEVLKSGEQGNETGAVLVFQSIVVGGLFKFLGSFVGLLKGSVEWATRMSERIFFIGCDVSPALVAVGYIVEIEIAVLIFIGGAAAWLVGIPLLGGGEGSAVEAAGALWSTQIRYIGVGAMVIGGIDSIFKVRKGLVMAVTELKGHMKRGKAKEGPETERNIDGTTILWLTAVCILFILGIYYHVTGNAGETAIAAVCMLVLSFFFTAVASYIVGLVGNSNSPVSGMTITAVLATGGLLYVMGYSGASGVLATLCVAGVVCCVACTSGDVCNDLKTGHLVGASPRNQQILQILGISAAAFVLAPVLIAMHEGSINMGGTGIGGADYPAPQANLFASLTKGFFMGGHLPWDMVVIGALVGIMILIVDKALGKNGKGAGLHLMPIAVGIYLPFGLSVPILIGGLIAHFVKKNSGAQGSENLKRGVLVASGVIAGESLVGVGLAILAYFSVSSMRLGAGWPGHIADLVSAGALALVCVLFYRWSFKK